MKGSVWPDWRKPVSKHSCLQGRTARFEALQTARNSLRSQDSATLDSSHAGR